MKKIGFTDMDIMGKSMVYNLRKAGYEVSICTRIKAKVEDMTTEGVRWCDVVAEYTKGQDVVTTIVGYPKDMGEVCFGESGVTASTDKGAYLTDITTTSLKLAVRTYERAIKVGLYALDAPIIGGDADAGAGTLATLTGGDKKAFDACLPVLEAMGKNINYEDKAGNGQHTEMCNQIAIVGAPAGVCEAMVYAKKVGLDVDVMLKSISTRTAGSAQMNDAASKVLINNLESEFFLKHFIKDMSLADEEAKDVSAELTILEDVPPMRRELEAEGMGDLRTQASIKRYNW